jgi:hypothetical protein
MNKLFYHQDDPRKEHRPREIPTKKDPDKNIPIKDPDCLN